MKTSESIKAIAPALLAAQQAIEAATKDAVNPHFKHKYADLQAVIGAVKEPLNDNGIVFLQALGYDPVATMALVETTLLHQTGEFISTTTPIYCAKPNDPQAFGSGVTYSKRYALQALLGLPTEDDDAEPQNQKSKPPVDIAKLKTDEGVAWLKGFGNAVAAKRAISASRILTLEAEAFIDELFDPNEVM